ncbi:MAG: hypothetical protein GY781_04380, partial [Gammaproteobacteria bacterium]|nr:hypothetical protein [Gammaproteobacteria bacterium]
AKVFGEGETFGSKRGKSKRSLKNYSFNFMTADFEDHNELASFDSHQQAIETVNNNLTSGKYKLNKIFEVAIPGTEEVLIGVSIGEGDGADTTILPIIDKSEIKHTAYMPYGVLISGNKVYSQHGEFRIASSFPDLGMITFLKISDAPDGIKNSLKQLTTK